MIFTQILVAFMLLGVFACLVFLMIQSSQERKDWTRILQEANTSTIGMTNSTIMPLTEALIKVLDKQAEMQTTLLLGPQSPQAVNASRVPALPSEELPTMQIKQMINQTEEDLLADLRSQESLAKILRDYPKLGTLMDQSPDWEEA